MSDSDIAGDSLPADDVVGDPPPPDARPRQALVAAGPLRIFLLCACDTGLWAGLPLQGHNAEPWALPASDDCMVVVGAVLSRWALAYWDEAAADPDHDYMRQSACRRTQSRQRLGFCEQTVCEAIRFVRPRSFSKDANVARPWSAGSTRSFTNGSHDLPNQLV